MTFSEIPVGGIFTIRGKWAIKIDGRHYRHHEDEPYRRRATTSNALVNGPTGEQKQRAVKAAQFLRLNEHAREHGFRSWSAFQNAVLDGTASIVHVSSTDGRGGYVERNS